MKKNIKLVYSYDGSDFFGSQRQPKLRTVQGEIERVLKIIFKESIDLITAGRTDRGVHSKKQVSNFYVDSKFPIDRLKRVLNQQLPNDILILDVQEVEMNFNSRFSAIYRAYEYYISEKQNPFKARYQTFVGKKLNIDRLNQIIKYIKGTHNFSNFRLVDCNCRIPIRTIYEAYFIRVDDESIKLYVKGNAFLKSQIRVIVGTVLDIYFKNKSENTISEMLLNYDKKYIKIVAEPQGLYLVDIGYKEERML